jgi:hypothetical protein
LGIGREEVSPDISTANHTITSRSGGWRTEAEKLEEAKSQ